MKITEEKFLQLIGIGKSIESNTCESNLIKPNQELLKYSISKIWDALRPEGETKGITKFPTMLMAKLPNELIDLLIYLALRHNTHHMWTAEQAAILRSFVLYWLLFVSNDGKAAWCAFEHALHDKQDINLEFVRNIIKKFEDREFAYFVPREAAICKLFEEIDTNDPILKHWSDRFKAADEKEDGQKPGEALRVLSTNGHRIRCALMWLQREYLESSFRNYDPTSDRDEDLPVDLDHIIPSSIFNFHWGNEFEDVSSEIRDEIYVKEYFRWRRGQLGNSLGNFRWLDLRKNRERQDSNYSQTANQYDFVKNPAEWDQIIETSVYKKSAQPRWTKENISKFQRLIDMRTLFLSKKILEEGGILNILPTDKQKVLR